MANSLQDNVLTYFQDPRPGVDGWISQAIAGIIRHGLGQHDYQDLTLRDSASGIVDHLKVLRQVCEHYELEVVGSPLSVHGQEKLDRIQQVTNAIEAAIARDEQKLEEAIREAGLEGKGLSPARKIEIRNQSLSLIKDELRSAEFGAVLSTADAGLTNKLRDLQANRAGTSLLDSYGAANTPPPLPGPGLS